MDWVYGRPELCPDDVSRLSAIGPDIHERTNDCAQNGIRVEFHTRIVQCSGIFEDAIII